MPYKDPVKQKEFQHQHYLKYKSTYLRNTKKRRDTLREWVYTFKDKCELCGYNKCKRALDFHHITPTDKVEEVGRLMRDSKSKELILTEIKKCIVLCANCHREVDCTDEHMIQ